MALHSPHCVETARSLIKFCNTKSTYQSPGRAWRLPCPPRHKWLDRAATQGQNNTPPSLLICEVESSHAFTDGDSTLQADLDRTVLHSTIVVVKTVERKTLLVRLAQACSQGALGAVAPTNLCFAPPPKKKI